MNNNEKKIIKLMTHRGERNINILTTINITDFNCIYYCVTYVDKSDNIKITYIRFISQNIIMADFNISYPIEEFVRYHNTGYFNEWLSDDFKINSAFYMMKALS